MGNFWCSADVETESEFAKEDNLRITPRIVKMENDSLTVIGAYMTVNELRIFQKRKEAHRSHAVQIRALEADLSDRLKIVKCSQSESTPVSTRKLQTWKTKILAIETELTFHYDQVDIYNRATQKLKQLATEKYRKNAASDWKTIMGGSCVNEDEDEKSRYRKMAVTRADQTKTIATTVVEQQAREKEDTLRQNLFQTMVPEEKKEEEELIPLVPKEEQEKKNSKKKQNSNAVHA